jgi:hypothetical protein
VTFKPKYALLVVCCALLPSFLISACSGPAFESAQSGPQDTSGGNGGSAAGSSGSVGNAAGMGVACGGPEDCNDNDACTRDRCNADGICDASPMCAGNEKCCAGGDCAECCEHADCDDGVNCTNNVCFSGQCMYVPDDSKCDATQYCSTNDDCRAKQICGLAEGEDVAEVCDDGSLCTTDSCSGSFCKHDFCALGSSEVGLCCPDKGCAKECCSDSQCDKDRDPCTVGVCGADGTCGDEVTLCGAGQHCCPSADGNTATCGTCCSAEDCDDGVACTEDKCGGGECSRTPDPERCDDGYYCDPAQGGCQKAPTCQQASDCEGKATSPCQINPSCVEGQCQFESCGDGSKCCETGCAACCDHAECDDGIACTRDECGPNGCSNTPDDSLCMGQMCDPRIGGCIECHGPGDCDDSSDCTIDSCNTETHTCVHANACAKFQVCNAGKCAQCASDSDCQGGVITMGEPNAAIGTCSVSRCLSGVCKTSTETCSGLEQCCPPYGCAIRCLATE